MPDASPRPCLTPGCGRSTTEGYCPDHHRRSSSSDARGSARERGYGTRWEKSRAGYLLKHPWCAICWLEKRRTAATVVDHIVPHKGNWTIFWDSTNWQPLCARCHGKKTAGEGSWGQYAVRPPAMTKTVVPLIVVCGPPGAGKMTVVARNIGEKELLIDVEVIKSALSHLPLFQADHAKWGREAMIERNRMLLSLCSPPPKYDRAFLLTGAPKSSDRRWWREVAGARVVLMLCPLERCLERLGNERPDADVEPTREAARKWWASYSADPHHDEVITPESSL